MANPAAAGLLLVC
uniref:Uncharacterized protein n=1 Tax=Arundo donax TaxID=35708 RepID=A0A0A9EUN3_ARUDO